MRRRLLSQPIDLYSSEEYQVLIKSAFIKSTQLKIITLNPEMIVNLIDNLEFQSAINNANLIVPDGTGITWAFKILNGESADRVPGIELAERILKTADELGKSLVIFGGSIDVLEKTISKFLVAYPQLKPLKAIDGYRGTDNDKEIALELSKFHPDLVLVALGSPRQEIWINKYSQLFPHSILIGVGGSLDVWSGKVKRAPHIMRDNGLEWFYRMVSQPNRTARILKSLPRFVWMVLRERIRNAS